jgi:opacity protein-like surface antigen
MASRTARAGAALILAALAAGPLRAQEPTGPPPPSSGKTSEGHEVHELLPDLGRIGSQVGFRGGASWNPYGVGGGFELGGFVDLPLARVPGGKLSYEIAVSLSDGESDPFTITDPIAYVANLAAGASPAAALAGPPAAPFPVRRLVRTDLRLLLVSPFALKYTILRLDHWRLRPYVVAGLGLVVTITKQIPERDESLQFTGTSPFDDPLIAGLVAQAPELAALGIPTGQGNMEFGADAGAGLEIRLSRGLSLNLDYRFLAVGGASQRLHSIGAALGFHW